MFIDRLDEFGGDGMFGIMLCFMSGQYGYGLAKQGMEGEWAVLGGGYLY